MHRKTTATRPLPIERAFKTDILTILSVYQQHNFNTNVWSCSEEQVKEDRRDWKLSTEKQKLSLSLIKFDRNYQIFFLEVSIRLRVC